MPALGKAAFAAAISELCIRDDDLARIVDRCGPPRRLSRTPGFATLVHVVFEQQVSLASALATFERLQALLPEFTPAAYLKLSDGDLRSAGVSRQKARYTRLIAAALEERSLRLESLKRCSDEEARARLTAITGVGNWTADVYLMAALRRGDLWPIGDLALVKALQQIKGLDRPVDKDVLLTLGEDYRPFRSVATHIYWQHYLHPE